ncbi:helix-turn-helix domain-containing protein [Streptosporangium longisporum]|uniref:SWIM-type domain-containing protein n=1 Tax=Streptosporangium longisporum TaxID=46187 RepID=A0ABP6L4C9_9ACTN
MNSQITLTTKEAASALNISLRTAQRWAATGKLAAVKEGGRWAITLTADLGDYKPGQLEKARELIGEGALLPTKRRGIFTSISSDGSTTYLVHHCACTCPAGLRGKHTCYHRAAVAIVTAATTQCAA